MRLRESLALHDRLCQRVSGRVLSLHVSSSLSFYWLYIGFALGNGQGVEVPVPDSCTVGQWKQMLGDGCLGDKILHLNICLEVHRSVCFVV